MNCLIKGILFIGLLSIIISCNKEESENETPCYCTQMNCDAFETSDTSIANARILIKVDSSYFNESDSLFMDIIVYDKSSLSKIDSTSIEFHLWGNKRLYSSYLYESNFISDIDFRNHSLQLINLNNNLSYSISNVHFKATIVPVVCNKCFPCEDQYVNGIVLKETRLELNSVEQDSLVVWLQK